MENEEVAIQFIKFDLGYGVYIFKPVGLLQGTYDDELEIFQTNYSETYESIKTIGEEVSGYFFAVKTIDDLKRIYGDEEKEMLFSMYYESFLDYMYVGLNNGEDIDVAVINIDSIDNLFAQKDEEELEKSEEENDEEKYLYHFTEKGLKELMNLGSLKEVRKVLSNLIGNDIKEELEKENETDKDYNPKHIKLDKNGSKKLQLSELKEEVLANIIGQDKTVNSVTTTMIVNENSNNPRHKAHILIAGPSGTGKTEMMNIISKKMNKPVFKADATAYTKEGYVGKSVYSMLKGLIEIANGDIEKAQNGILIIDEIDKKVSSRGDDVSGTAVLNSLLKIMDRDVIEVDTTKEETIPFDTSKLTIVFMGAFSDLYEKKNERKTKSIGFSVDEEEKTKEIEINKEDLIEYGLPPEFLGRISNITYTKALKEEDLIKILKKSKISPLKMEEEFFKDLGVEFKYTNGYISQLAANCLKHKTGARELKSEVQKSLEGAYEEVLNNPGKVKVLKLTKETAKDNKKYKTE